MQYTQEEIAWFQARVAQGVTAEQAQAELNAFKTQQAQAQVQPVAQVQSQPVAQAPAGLSVVQNLAGLAAEGEDQTSTNGGGLPAAGLCHIRFKSYIEIGIHQPKNQTHKPGMVAIIVVELHTPQHMRSVNGVQEPQTLEIRLPKSNGKNSRWPKFVKSVQKALKDQLGYDLTNMSQALGHACLGTITHNDGYANLNDGDVWSFEPSKATNKITGQMEEVAIPPLHGEPQLFMFDNPKINADPANVKWMWDSIFVEGTYTKKDEATGVETEKSRNYYQLQISKSQGWQTSTVYKMLKDLGCTVDFGESVPTVANTTTVGAVQALPQSLPQAPQTLPNAGVSAQVNTSIPANVGMQVQPMTTANGVGSVPAQNAAQTVVNAQIQPTLAVPQGVVTSAPVEQAMQPVPTMQVPDNTVGEVMQTMQPTPAQTAPQLMDASQFMNQFAQ